MINENPDELRKQLISLIELSRRPHLSNGTRAIIALQMSALQEQLDSLSN